MPLERSIPSSDRGTRATMAAMADLAWEGQDTLLAVALADVAVDSLDATLRRLWFYLPDGKVETIRTIDRMAREFNASIDCFVDGAPYGHKPPGLVAGDCDDAATLAAAVLLHARRMSNDVGKIWFVAVRPALSAKFEHVFLMFEYRGQPLRVDPTAPDDADYSRWETFTFSI